MPLWTGGYGLARIDPTTRRGFHHPQDDPAGDTRYLLAKAHLNHAPRSVFCISETRVGGSITATLVNVAGSLH